MPWFAVGLSIMASLLSTISYLASPGEMIKNGPTMALAWLVRLAGTARHWLARPAGPGWPGRLAETPLWLIHSPGHESSAQGTNPVPWA